MRTGGQHRKGGGTAVAALKAQTAAALLQMQTVRLSLALRAFDPNQPRVPKGSPDGGEWTKVGGTTTRPAPAKPQAEEPNVILVQGRPRGGGSGLRRTGGGRVVEPTIAEQMQLAATFRARQAAVAKVRERDPNWREPAESYETIRGEIRHNENVTRAAEARFLELQRNGIGPGPYARESIPTRGPERNFTAQERQEINRIGRENGCHTCGRTDPGTAGGNFVPDHQLPNSWPSTRSPQRLFPQCIHCSRRQGGTLGPYGPYGER